MCTESVQKVLTTGLYHPQMALLVLDDTMLPFSLLKKSLFQSKQDIQDKSCHLR